MRQAGRFSWGCRRALRWHSAKSKAEVSAVQLRMVRAGYRKDSAVQIFYGTKFLLMVVFVVLAVVTGLASLNYLIVILVALALGFLALIFGWAGRFPSGQKQIRLGLPDLLDLADCLC